MGLFINVGIGAIIAIAVIVGLILGFCKQFSKRLCAIASILIAIILVNVLFPLVAKTGVLDKLTNKVSSWFTPKFFSVVINDAETLKKTISGNFLSVLSSASDQVFAFMEGVLGGTNLKMTLGNFFARVIVSSVCETILWLALYLIIKYFLFGVKYLLSKISKVVVFKSIDKIFGMLWAVACTYLIVVGVVLTVGEIVVVQFIPKAEPTLAKYISQSILLKVAHETNLIGSYVASAFNLSLVKL